MVSMLCPIYIYIHVCTTQSRILREICGGTGKTGLRDMSSGCSRGGGDLYRDRFLSPSIEGNRSGYSKYAYLFLLGFFMRKWINALAAVSQFRCQQSISRKQQIFGVNGGTYIRKPNLKNLDLSTSNSKNFCIFL